MVIKKHKCLLDFGSDSLLPKTGGMWHEFGRSIRKLGQVSQHHPHTYDHFVSFPAVMAERQRQLYDGGNYVIHPFSLFSLAWKSFMILLNLAHMTTTTTRVFYIVEPAYYQSLHPLDYVILLLNILCWMDVAVSCSMGYVERGPEGPSIVLDRTRILWNYMSTWFVIDLLSSFPVAFIFLAIGLDTRSILIAHILSLFRLARIYTVAVDLTTFVKIFTQSYAWYGALQQVMLFCVTAHWCSCLIFMPTIFTFYWYGKFNVRHALFLTPPGGDSMHHIPFIQRYSNSMFISISGFFGTGFSMYIASEPAEVMMHGFIIIYSSLFMVYNFVFLLKVYMTIYTPTIRYHELMNQVEEYMRLKQFPVPLKKRVRTFYYYRYQEQYYSEETVLNSLSEELRNEITLHTCHKLVDKVSLFKDVPASVVGSVLGCLHAEVYLPNDSVLRAGEIGDCMYFIANGTVAVYSLKGVEVCHLEDGAHFGEVALLMKDSKRVATVVAVEITQVYRLDVADFRKFVLSNVLLHERIEALASKRMHETVILDEDLRRERERLQELHQSFTSSI